MKARNAYTAALNDTPPGEVGEFDEKNAAVAAWLAAGMLAPIVEDKPEPKKATKA